MTTPNFHKIKLFSPLGQRAVATGACLALILVSGAAWLGQQWSLRSGMVDLRASAGHRLDLFSTRLNADLTRFDYLPKLLEMTPLVDHVLRAQTDRLQVQTLNDYLDRVNATVGSEVLMLLDANGSSLAVSNWDKPDSTIGKNLGFRPYVTEALKQGTGQFYGIGVTSKEPGYYLSYALHEGSRTRGLVVVKVNIAAAERIWAQLPGEILITDEHGVVILGTRSDLKFKPLSRLSEDARAEILRTRPYGDNTLQTPHWKVRETLSPDTQIVELDGKSFLASTRQLHRAPWQMLALDSLSGVHKAARIAAITAGLTMLVCLLLLLAWWQRHRAIRQKLASRAKLQAAHDSLEATVAARTAELQAAQNELVHAGKLAALGQMSAGLVHELNQPLTALRTLSDSANILLDQGRTDEVHGNLNRIANMVDRLARLTLQLKIFAYKSEAPLVAIYLPHALNNAQALVADLMRSENVNLNLDFAALNYRVLADEAALSSVFSNLMRNAVDAMHAAPRRQLSITAQLVDGRVQVRFSDTGPGIASDILPRLFEPFVTSKPMGKGLGLGLLISAQLVAAMHGKLSAYNSEGGGACFTVELPLVTE